MDKFGKSKPKIIYKYIDHTGVREVDIDFSLRDVYESVWTTHHDPVKLSIHKKGNTIYIVIENKRK